LLFLERYCHLTKQSEMRSPVNKTLPITIATMTDAANAVLGGVCISVSVSVGISACVDVSVSGGLCVFDGAGVSGGVCVGFGVSEGRTVESGQRPFPEAASSSASGA
jgi:hypothetical protein